MAIKNLTRMGNPILRKVARKLSLEEIKSDYFNELLIDLKDSMVHYGGVGIAAPQIGESVAVCIMEIKLDNPRYDIKENVPLTVFINPEIEFLTDEKQGFWEGCLSVPGLRGYVERPNKIKIRYLDIFGESKSLVAEGFHAIVIQHELDHLFGKLYIDRMTDMTKLSYSEEYSEFLSSE